MHGRPMSDSPDDNSRKPLTARQRWKNLWDALAEDALTDMTPPTKEELAKAARMKQSLLERAESEISG